MSPAQGGEYYTVHGAAAYFIADLYFKTRVDVRWSGEEKLATLNLRANKVGSIIADALRVRRMQAELWQREGGDWTCSKKVRRRTAHAAVQHAAAHAAIHWSCCAGFSRQPE